MTRSSPYLTRKHAAALLEAAQEDQWVGDAPEIMEILVARLRRAEACLGDNGTAHVEELGLSEPELTLLSVAGERQEKRFWGDLKSGCAPRGTKTALARLRAAIAKTWHLESGRDLGDMLMRVADKASFDVELAAQDIAKRILAQGFDAGNTFLSGHERANITAIAAGRRSSGLDRVGVARWAIDEFPSLSFMNGPLRPLFEAVAKKLPDFTVRKARPRSRRSAGSDGPAARAR